MNLSTATGVQLSLDNQTWYNLTDHNRDPISINYELIESTARMANGTLRKYVVAKKFKITASWKSIPTIDTELVDYIKSVQKTATGVSTQNTITVADTKRIFKGMLVSGYGIGAEAVVTSISSNTITLSVVNSDAVSGNVTFTDYNKGPAWIKAFYEGNAFAPVYIRLIYAKEKNAVLGSIPNDTHTTSYNIGANPTDTNNPAHLEQAFMTSFTYEIIKRMPRYDYVNMSIEFTEI